MIHAHQPPQINKQVACLVANVYQEASIAGGTSQTYIAIVTINRAIKRYHSHAYSHLCDVVFKPYQFSWTRYFEPQLQGKYSLTKFREYYHVTNEHQWNRAELSVARAIIMEHSGQADTNMLYYHDNTIRVPYWGKEMTVVYKNEHFTFYDTKVQLGDIRKYL